MPTLANELTLTLPRLHKAQLQVLKEAKRFNALMAGRRFGKSTLGRHLVIHEALKARPAAWIAPNYKLLQDSWRECLDVMGPAITVKSEEEKRIQIAGGGAVEFWSADGAGEPARSRKYGLMVFDEAGLVSDLERLWTRALRPTLTDLQGSAWFLGTPKGSTGYFATLFDYGQGEREGWKSWRFGTVANPHILASAVEQARADMPRAAFQQEFEGALVSWSGSVFRSLERAIVDDPLEPIYQQWNRWQSWYSCQLEFAVGVDWAGRSGRGDFTAFVVAASDGTVCYVDRFRGLDYAVQRARLQTLISGQRTVPVLVEDGKVVQIGWQGRGCVINSPPADR